MDLNAIARLTTGFSGADLATLLNEAAIAAASNNTTTISKAHVDFALEKLQIGLRRPSHSNDRTRRYIAVHEAGHAAAALLTGYDNVSKVTILPRSNGVGGFTSFANSGPEEHGGLPTRERLLSELVVLLGGRVAEELAFGQDRVTVGASDDLQRVRKLALAMINKYGMAEDEFGLLLGAGRDMDLLGVPDDVGRRTERYAQGLVRRAHARCRHLLRRNWRFLTAMRDALLDRETIGTDEVNALLEEHRTAWWWQRSLRLASTRDSGTPLLPAGPAAVPEARSLVQLGCGDFR